MEFNEIIVKDVALKDTIYTYLKRNGYSENYVKNLRKKGGYILLNNKIAFTDARINNGDILKLNKNPNTSTSIMQCVIPLDIVYEDEDLLIVNKPSNLSTSASRSHFSENLSGAILSYMSRKTDNFVVRIVNRLDKETAGLIIVAKHSYISNLLNENDYTKKTYYAICRGEIKEPITIDKNIATIKNELGYNQHKRIISNDGKPAITYVTPVSFDGKNTLCKISIEHGRTHQIRVHLSSINHPLLGDGLYGEPSEEISHTALLCKEIELYHPIKKKTILLSCPFPDDFKTAFKANVNWC